MKMSDWNLRKKIREELEEGVKRNKVLPLDWAMDRIDDVLEEFTKRLKEEFFESDDQLIYDKRFIFRRIDKLAGNKLVKENLKVKNKQYKKEIEECFNKHIKLLHHNTDQIFLRYVNETARINAKYFKEKE